MKNRFLFFSVIIALVISVCGLDSCTPCEHTPGPTVTVYDTIYLHDTLDCAIDRCFGAIGCYHFTGNAKDSSGNSLHGNAVNVTLTTDKKGNPNSAYHFSGYNGGSPSYIDLPNYANFETNNEVTISLWCKKDNVGQSPILFCMSPDNPNDRLVGTYFWTAAYNNSAIWDHGNTSSGRCLSSTLQTIPSASTWCHFVFVRSKTSNFMKTYFNGTEIASKSSSIDISNKNLPMRIGGGGYESGNYTGYFIGTIDEVKIFNRALSASEVLEIYNAEN